MGRKGKTVLTVEMPKSLHEKFKMKATKQGIEMSGLVRKFIQIFVQNEGMNIPSKKGKTNDKTK